MVQRLVLLLALLVVVGAFAGCGGSSKNQPTSDPASSNSPPRSSGPAQSYLVSTQINTGGTITPSSSTVTTGETTTFTVTPRSGYTVGLATGCDGSLTGDLFTTGSVTANCLVKVEFAPIMLTVGGHVSGAKSPLQLNYLDSTGARILDIDADGPFVGSSEVPYGSSFQLTVATQPVNQSCEVSKDSGEAFTDVTDIQVVCQAVIENARISGTISAGNSVTYDSDINDIFAPFTDNSTSAAPQLLNHQTTLHGFASAIPTGGAQDQERFADSPDPDDFFHLILEAGQTLQLQVVDFNGLEVGSRFNGDLDLYVFDAELNLLAVSDSVTEFEEITVATSQEYIINIHAHEGVSKYVLRIMPASISGTTTLTTAALTTMPPEFIANEMIVKYRDSQAGLSSKPGYSGGPSPRTNGRSARLGIDAVQLPPTAAMHALNRRNPIAHDQLLTLRSIKEMRKHPEVLYAEPNYVRKGLITPSDPNFGFQWHYTNIDLPEAWEYTTGMEHEVVVAVIDTGLVLEHPDFDGQLIAGYDFIANAERARDDDGIE